MCGLLASLLAEHRIPVWEEFDGLTWSIVIAAGLIASWVIWKAVHYTMHPGETEEDHIKRSILNEPDTVDVQISSGDSSGSGSRPDAPSANGACR